MALAKCEATALEFAVDDLEIRLRRKLSAPFPRLHPTETLHQLLAFWHHFGIHRRKSDFSGKEIISVFDEHCPYPVWHREEWISQACPPTAEYKFSLPFWDQLWDLFKRCPIAHNVGLGNENCDYADDWWYSKNCYLCHSGVENEDCYYCYRLLRCRDSQYCTFAFDCELCREVLNCFYCYSVLYAINCRNCRDSAFLFDCRNCTNCLLCWNLRNCSYRINNQQYTKEEYERERAKYDFSDSRVYEEAKAQLARILLSDAWWKAIEVEKCENSSGSYLERNKNCENCYFVQETEDTANLTRAYGVRDCVDGISIFKSQLVYLSALVQDNGYDVRYSFNVSKSQSLEYCGNCYNCKHCFACCGLVGKEYCVLNREYSKVDYERLVGQIKEQLKQAKLEGLFFPPRFAPHYYEESLAAFYFPLSMEAQKRLGYRVAPDVGRKAAGAEDISEIPSGNVATEEVCHKVFWDDLSKRPFKVTKFDLEFSHKLGVPLPNRFYIRSIKELFSWMYFNGELRETRCKNCNSLTRTHLPKNLDARILCHSCHEQLVI